MSEPFLGEIKMVGFNFAPTGWALCNGQTMSFHNTPRCLPCWAPALAGPALQVTSFNPALRLYDRLGFEVAGQDEVGVEMRWSPAGRG